ncbi:MAG: TlpA family protein disulfide reductase [Ignavibacteriales bacterium]|nr:TlpA family protein disulfide reductase [Ignavibacteriales bacterium]
MSTKRRALIKYSLPIALFLSAFLVFGMTVPPPEKAPDFKLKNGKGETVTLSSLRGKVVVINFWATWCAPCRAEIPGFLDVYDEYKSKGLEIIGISLDSDGWESIKPFVNEYDITYPVVLGERETVRNYGGITAIPTTFVVDRNGNIAAHHVGYMSKSDFLRTVKQLL